MRIEVWTDGSSSGAKGGPGGYSALVRALRDGEVVKEVIVQGGDKDTTNQRMEVKALVEGLRALERPAKVVVYTDSAYLMNCIVQRWYVKWRANGWLNKDEEPVANKDLWLELLGQIERGHDLQWVKLKGHVKTTDRKGKPKTCEHGGCECKGDMSLHDLNNRVDALANEAKVAIRDHGTVAGLLLTRREWDDSGELEAMSVAHVPDDQRDV